MQNEGAFSKSQVLEIMSASKLMKKMMSIFKAHRKIKKIAMSQNNKLGKRDHIKEF